MDYAGAAPTAAVANARSGFLAAIRRLPKADVLWMQLFEPEIVNLAARDFRQNPYADPSPELEQRIERWAVSCYLAYPSVRNWWIFDVARQVLRYRACGPLSSGFTLEDDGNEEIDVFESVGVPVALSEDTQQLTYLHSDWDLRWVTERRYLRSETRAFKRYLEERIKTLKPLAAKPAVKIVNRRDSRHYEWLAKYQLLGQSFSDISKTRGDEKHPDTVKTTVLKLRNLVGLPSRRSPGRPRK
jgi:hypothetical protein